MRKKFTVRADADEDKNKRAAEIEAAVKRADAEKEQRAKADAEMKTGMEKLTDSVAKMCDTFGEFGKRLDAIENKIAGQPEDQDGNLGDAEDRATARADQTPSHFGGDEERAARADAQARCDAVACAFGEQAPPPMAGERVIDYRKRLLKPFQRHSRDFGKVDLGKIDASAIEGIEARIYADALAAASRPMEVSGNQLYQRTRRDESGHTVNEFFGNAGAWMNQFAGARQRATGTWKASATVPRH